MPLCWQSTDSWGRVARAEPRCESGERERMSEIKRANGGRGKNKNVRQQRRRRFFTGRMWNKGQEKMLKPTESVGESGGLHLLRTRSATGCQVAITHLFLGSTPRHSTAHTANTRGSDLRLGMMMKKIAHTAAPRTYTSTHSHVRPQFFGSLTSGKSRPDRREFFMSVCGSIRLRSGAVSGRFSATGNTQLTTCCVRRERDWSIVAPGFPTLFFLQNTQTIYSYTLRAPIRWKTTPS